jgi:uncharacterized integral membrane protein
MRPAPDGHPVHARRTVPAPRRFARTFSQYCGARSILAQQSRPRLERPVPLAAGTEDAVGDSRGELPVRYVYIALIALFTIVVLSFKIQNLDTATVTLFSASVTLPVSVLVVGVYVLGMLTGGFLASLVRSWIRGARGVD